MPLFGVELKDIGSAVGAVGTVAKDLRAAITGKSVVDPAAEAQLQAKILELEQMAATAQVELNKAEAASASVFVSGWRPFLGWVLGLAVAYQFVIRPILLGIFPSIPLVTLSMDELWPMVAGMLGLIGARSYEKVRGAARG
jgi:hypothetical protein